MTSAYERFNNLHGVRSSRFELVSIVHQAKKENNTAVIYRLEKILNENPDSNYFILEIEQYPSKGLSAPRHTGSYKEALDNCGRLRKGFKFENGTVVKVQKKSKKPVEKPTKENKPPEKSTVKPVVKDQKKTKIERTGKASNYGTKRKKAAAPKTQETRTFEKKSFAPEEWQKADTRKTTSLIKKYLKEKFGIDCRVKSEYYSGGSSLNIWYDFGPSEKELEADIKRLQYGSFDGMTDMYNYGDESENGIILDGFILNEYKYVFVSREIPKSFYVTLAKLVSEKDKFNDVPEFNGSESTLYDNFPKMFGEFWSWGQLVRSKFWRANYVTQKEEEIQNIEIQGDYNDYYLTYTVNGKKYDSRKPAIYPTKMVKEKNIIKNLIKFIDYGKDEVAVIGYTGEISEELEEVGGKPSNTIKFQGENHKGYIFHKSKADSVANILINYAQEDKSTGLSAPFHVGIARTALDSCSRLKKGFKYLPGGNIEKVAAKKKGTPTKKAPKQLEKTEKSKVENNPVPFSKKPKSSSVQTAIKDILGLPKFKGVKELPASLLFKNFKDEPHLVEPKEIYLSEYEKGILSKDSKLHTYYEFQQWLQELTLTSLGEDFILAVRGRLESLRNQKHNYAMFDGLANPGPEIIVMDSEQKPTAVLPIFPIQPIHENKVENWIETPVPVREEKAKRLSSGAQRLFESDFEVLPINEEWSELMQNPAANLKIAIWGKPKNGKTSASIQLAKYFTEFGKVLYNFADQGFNLSTKELWNSEGLFETDAEPSDISTTQELEAEIATGQYKFVFIDMISDYIRKEKLKPEEFKERFIKRFPDVSFILIFEVTKSGDFKGDQGWTHVVDAIMTVENFFMENRGRYGMGERIIWEEGFQRFNPKRYEEYMREKRDLEADNAPVETVIN